MACNKEKEREENASKPSNSNVYNFAGSTASILSYCGTGAPMNIGLTDYSNDFEPTIERKYHVKEQNML